MIASRDGMAPWRIVRGTLCLLVAVFLLAPLVVVVIISFSSAPFLQFPPPGLSLRWYAQLFSTPAWINALVVSVEMMVPSSILATLMGTAAAYALLRGRVPGARLIMACLMLPIVVPGMITAAALFGVYRGLGLNGTLTGLVIGHTVLNLPYVLATVSSALRVQDTRLEQAASNPPGRRQPWGGHLPAHHAPLDPAGGAVVAAGGDDSLVRRADRLAVRELGPRAPGRGADVVEPDG